MTPAITDFRACGTIIGPAGLTAVFGMGTGVAPPVWSPRNRPHGAFKPSGRESRLGLGPRFKPRVGEHAPIGFGMSFACSHVTEVTVILTGEIAGCIRSERARDHVVGFTNGMHSR